MSDISENNLENKLENNLENKLENNLENILYELVFMCRSDMSYFRVESVSNDLRKLISDSGGDVSKVEYWGIRDLAYEIKRNQRAHYSLMNVSMPVDRLAELKRSLDLNNAILRYLLTKVAKHEEASSPLMQGKERGRYDERESASKEREKEKAN